MALRQGLPRHCWVSSVGSYVDRFEQMVAARAGMRFGVAAVNGTSALQTSLLVADAQPNSTYARAPAVKVK